MSVRKPAKKPSQKDYFSWLREGVEKGYCSDVYCENHDTIAPGSNDLKRFMELVEEYESRDFCWPIMRSYYGMEG
mgnify:CR=1 FL=1